jgi:outer membrane protein, heavy metal efflux system
MKLRFTRHDGGMKRDSTNHGSRAILAAALLVSMMGCSVHQVGGGNVDTSASSVPRLFEPVPGPMLGTSGKVTFEPKVDGGRVPCGVVTAAHRAGEPAGQKDETLPSPRRLLVDSSKPNDDPNAVTLDQVINTVLLADPRIRAGFESINQATGDALTASLKPNPNVAIAQTLLPLTRPFTEDAQGGPPQLDVGISYPIDWFLFGKRAAAMQAAGLAVPVSEAEYADLIRQRVLEAATGYYDVMEAKALLDLARQDAANLKRVEEITQKAVEGGGRPQVELGRIRLDRLRAEQGVRDAENESVAARARLRALMGRANLDPEFDVSGTLEDIATPELPLIDVSFAIATQNRPDIEALRRRTTQANAIVVAEQRQAYPEVTPQIGYTRQFQQKAIGLPDANSFGFGVEMSLPVFDRNQGNRLRATSVAMQQQFELHAGLVELRSEVIQADQELRTVLANTKAVAEEQLKLAEEVRDSLNKAYEAGGRPLIDVLDAQRNYRETYRLFIESRANLGRAGVRFNAILGKKVTP